MTQEEIKKALQVGPVFEGGGGIKIEWTIAGCRWHYPDGTIGEWHKTFIDDAMNVDYLSSHLFLRQGFFGQLSTKK